MEKIRIIIIVIIISLERDVEQIMDSFGINPIRGGIPPKDKSSRMRGRDLSLKIG